MGSWRRGRASGLRLPLTAFGPWLLKGLGRFIHRTTPETGVVHSSDFGETNAKTHATVDAPRGHRGWVGTVLGAQMRDQAAAAARRAWAATAAAGVAVLLVTACNEADAPDPTLTSSPVSSTPSTATPTASPSETKSESPEERDAKLAGEAVVALWAVVGELAEDPAKNQDLLDTVARDQARTQWQVVLDTYVAKGLVQRGKALVTDVQAASKKGKTFAVTACVDVSGVDLVDKTGNSKVNPDRPDQQKYSYIVTKTNGDFFVTVDTLKGTPC
jgi:broad specificity phosphatase PhoE